jgi:hypothetical protein
MNCSSMKPQNKELKMKHLSKIEVAIIKARIFRGDKYSEIAADFRINQGLQGYLGCGLNIETDQSQAAKSRPEVQMCFGEQGSNQKVSRRRRDEIYERILDTSSIQFGLRRQCIKLFSRRPWHPAFNQRVL